MRVELTNGTPFAAEGFVLPDPDGQEAYLVVLAATFVGGGGPPAEDVLRPSEEQRPVRPVDEYYGDPAASSVRYEGELALQKPRVDFLVNASAYAPGGEPARVVPVALRVGDHRKDLLVHGDRRRMAGMFASRPEPFTVMPIVYERAAGGTVLWGDPPKSHVDRFNPVGVGHRGARSSSPAVQSDYPNVEAPGGSGPAGYGAIARGWRPRIDFAGTYDAAWLADRAPLLPADFNPLHNQAAPADQQFDAVAGGETVELLNMTPGGAWGFRLPRLDMPVNLFYADRREQASLRVDTILIEPDERRVTLTARLRIPLERGPRVLRGVALGHMKNSWVRAKETRRTYLDRKGDGGVDREKRAFTAGLAP